MHAFWRDAIELPKSPMTFLCPQGILSTRSNVPQMPEFPDSLGGRSGFRTQKTIDPSLTSDLRGFREMPLIELVVTCVCSKPLASGPKRAAGLFHYPGRPGQRLWDARQRCITRVVWVAYPRALQGWVAGGSREQGCGPGVSPSRSAMPRPAWSKTHACVDPQVSTDSCRSFQQPPVPVMLPVWGTASLREHEQLCGPLRTVGSDFSTWAAAESAGDNKIRLPRPFPPRRIFCSPCPLKRTKYNPLFRERRWCFR